MKREKTAAREIKNFQGQGFSKALRIDLELLSKELKKRPLPSRIRLAYLFLFPSTGTFLSLTPPAKARGQVERAFHGSQGWGLQESYSPFYINHLEGDCLWDPKELLNDLIIEWQVEWPR